MKRLYKSDYVVFIICGVLLVWGIVSKIKGSSSTTAETNTRSTQTISNPNEFTSESDVLNFVSGKTFTQFPLGLTATANSDNVWVVSYSGNTAIVKVVFDASEMIGREEKQTERFEVNKTTGEYKQLEHE